MKVKQSILPLTPYKPGKGIDEVKKEHNLARIVKLASNENAYGCSPYVSKMLSQKKIEFAVYPDGYAEKLRLKLAKQLNVHQDELIFGSGSEEIIQFICSTFLESGTNTIMANPTFPQYKHYAVTEGSEVREVPLIDGKHDTTNMLKKVDEHTRVIWLCSPNNPTGCYINTEELNDFLQKVPKDILVVLDEAYYEFVTANDYPETVPLLNDYPNIIILRTFSKAYGLAGLRVGYGISSETIISNLNKIRGPFNVTSLAQDAAFYALDDQDYLEQIREMNIKTRTDLEQFCSKNDLHVDQSETNFLLIHLPKSGLEVSDRLLSYGFIVRPGELLGVPNSIRVSIGKKDEMEEFKKVIVQCL